MLRSCWYKGEHPNPQPFYPVLKSARCLIQCTASPEQLDARGNGALHWAAAGALLGQGGGVDGSGLRPRVAMRVSLGRCCSPTFRT